MADAVRDDAAPVAGALPGWVAGAVTFPGYCKPIWPHLAAADIVVQPSLREPFGNAVVEAQLSSRPVVATSALGHLESIDDEETGLLVPPEGDQVPFELDQAAPPGATRVAPDGAVLTLADGELTRYTTASDDVLADSLTQASYTLVGATPLVVDGGRGRVPEQGHRLRRPARGVAAGVAFHRDLLPVAQHDAELHRRADQQAAREAPRQPVRARGRQRGIDHVHRLRRDRQHRT